MESRHPHLILGVDHGASPQDATLAFARKAKRVRRDPDAPFTLEDLTWALNELEHETETTEHAFVRLRVPAEPGLYLEPDSYEPPVAGMARRTVHDPDVIAALRAAVRRHEHLTAAADARVEVVAPSIAGSPHLPPLPVSLTPGPWYVGMGGEQHGPYERTAIAGWHAHGQLPAGTLVWAEHLDDWQPIASVFGPGAHDSRPQQPPPRWSQGPRAGPAASSPREPRRPSWASGRGAKPAGSRGAAPRQMHGPLASLGRRLGAVAVDALVIWLAYVGAVAAGMITTLALGETVGGSIASVLMFATALTLTTWYVVALARLGQTYGKHVLSVQVVSAESGEPLRMTSALARTFVQAVGAYVFGIGWLWALVDDQRRSLHDKVVGSVVVKGPARPRLSPLAHFVAAFRAAD